MTPDEMIANGMDPNTEVEIPLALEQIDLLIKDILWISFFQSLNCPVRSFTII